MDHQFKCLVLLMLVGLSLITFKVLDVQISGTFDAVPKSNSMPVVKRDLFTKTRIRENMTIEIPTNENHRKPAELNHDQVNVNFSVSGEKVHPMHFHIANKSVQETAGNKNTCTFYLDEKSMLQAKETLFNVKPFYLYYINLETDAIMFQQFSKEERDDLLHWEYVKKKESFLIQLPIDFDLLTFSILFSDHEEVSLNVKLLYNKSICGQNYNIAVQSIKSLLWSELLQNNTDFYLCNRHYEADKWRHILYFITTIWIGFDSSCSEASFASGIQEVSLNKDDLPLIKPLICYVLSLQFVWIFAILDINLNESSPESNSISLTSYVKSDRPYGLKRFIFKILYSDCKFCLEKPVLRFLLIIWVLILMPFGFYRTIERHSLSESIFKDYTNVVRPNEPALLIFSDDFVICLFDCIYAVFIPFFYIIIGKQSYEIFVEKYVWSSPCSCCSNQSADEERTFNSIRLSDRLAFPCHLICDSLPCCNPGKKVGIKKGCLGCWFCLLPCIPFSCNKHLITYQCPHVERLRSSKKVFCILTCCLYPLIVYVLFLRPIFSTFTFILRSFISLVFVTLPIRTHIMRFTILIVTTIIYIFNYLSEIINMNVEILHYIFSLTVQNVPSSSSSSLETLEVQTIREDTFVEIYMRLQFVRKTFYIICFKIALVFMSLFIAIETFIIHRDSLTGTNFSEMVQFVLIVISPYAVSLFLKLSKENFLTEENKNEIRQVFNRLFPNGSSRVFSEHYQLTETSPLLPTSSA